MVKKNYDNRDHTLMLADLTSQDFVLMDAGARLQRALEERLDATGFVLAGQEAKYRLKYKVEEFDAGSRFARLATFGIADAAQGRLKVKAALYKQNQMVGAWIIDSWLKGGFTGGSDSELFEKAAEEITQHLKGDGLY
ncbi:MAG: hypothetical protein GWM98_03195 [Nitrospinaceae bacterium]|nr:hypothetical protein [Nitrospinaceae bacterium]NIR53696.1 hypothetical protein [Nitrospinaceae bacterium]NIS84107.1 hypothetical protein [Nitrospinaceae bacterium]NIT80907.1 hypothetical protein [Nitrospinaceae bacterium]NIU43205.1 hypothetical protein [Nitrospinaceae bacterium]